MCTPCFLCPFMSPSCCYLACPDDSDFPCIPANPAPRCPYPCPAPSVPSFASCPSFCPPSSCPKPACQPRSCKPCCLPTTPPPKPCPSCPRCPPRPSCPMCPACPSCPSFPSYPPCPSCSSCTSSPPCSPCKPCLPCRPSCPEISFVSYPACPRPTCPPPRLNECPSRLVCFASYHPPKNGASKSPSEIELKPCKSYQLIGGTLMMGCDCRKHNGLQDNCKRRECQGSVLCKARQWACCAPSKYSGGKHLENKLKEREC